MAKKDMNKKKETVEEETDQAAAADNEETVAEETELSEQVTLTREQMQEFKTKIEEIEARRDEYLDNLKRSRAEFENFRKRNASVRSDSEKEGIRHAVEVMLPVLDNLERALASAEQNGQDDALKAGVEMTCHQFYDTLLMLEIEEIPTDEGFDPNWHDAVVQSEAADGEEDGHIQEVLQKGYKQGDRVIRHAMVKVAKK